MGLKTLTKYIAMYMRIFENFIKRTITNILGGNSREDCRYLRPGIYSCNNKNILALYRVRDWSINLYELSHLDYIYNLRRFLDVFHIEQCRISFLTDIEPINIDEYLSKLNRRIQIKLTELELDKTNVRLRNYLEKLIEVRKKVLMGINPIRAMIIIALTCENNVDLRDLNKYIHNVETALNIDLDPVLDRRYAEALANFRSQ